VKTNELLEVGFLLYCDPYASHMESRGISYSGQALEKAIPKPAHRQLLPIIKKLVKQLETFWNAKIDDVMAEYQIEDSVSFLYHTFMGIQGHGVSLDDFLDDNNIKNFKYDTSPFYDEMCDIWNIATFDAYQAMAEASKQNNNLGRWKVISQYSDDTYGETYYFAPHLKADEVKRLLITHENLGRGIKVKQV